MKLKPSSLQFGVRLSIFLLLLSLVLLQSGCLRKGIYHQVETGQTLYRISKTYGVDEAYIARINGIPNPTQLSVGTRIFIPGVLSKKYVPATVPRTNSVVKNVPLKKAPLPRKASSKGQKPSKATVEIPQTVKSIPSRAVSIKSSEMSIKLRWPLRGKILRAFGQKGKGGGKGLEIAAKEGTKVSAAAAGKVIYSGDGVQGFGHLMILQHENDIFTVYGFNSKNYVKQGQFVSQGERIASSGRPPSGEAGRLHFEVRVGKLAVDPILYLP